MAGIQRTSDFGHVRKVKRKLGKKAAWEASYANPRYGEPNEKRRIYGTFRLRTEATSWLARERDSISAGIWNSPAQLKAMRAAPPPAGARTFQTLTQTWIETNGHEPSVVRTNESSLRMHILPRWGHVPVDEITREDVLLWGINDLAPGRPGARRNAYGVFSAIMSMAADLGIIKGTPCTPMVTEKVLQSCQTMTSRRHAPRALSDEEISLLIEALPATAVPLFKFLLMTGLRIGEARELRWKDIDLEAARMSIDRAVSGDGKTIAISTPKTVTSKRTRVLGKHSLQILGEIRDARSKVRPNDLVFPAVTDPAKHYSAALFNKNLGAACRALGIPRVSAHDLRNTWADRGGRNAESIKDVQEALGHTTASMSIHYMKSNDAAQRTLQAAVEDQFTTAIDGGSDND